MDFKRDEISVLSQSACFSLGFMVLFQLLFLFLSLSEVRSLRTHNKEMNPSCLVFIICQVVFRVPAPPSGTLLLKVSDVADW